MKTKRFAALLMAGVMALSQGMVYGEELSGEIVVNGLDEEITSGKESIVDSEDDLSFVGDASGQCGNYLEYSFSDGTLTISGIGSSYDWPPESAPWYEFKEEITNLVIEKGISGIGTSAFYNLTNLTSVTLPEGLTNIGYGAFMNCTSLTDIKFPNGMLFIGNAVFGGCTNLKNVIIPDSVTVIGMGCFGGCSSLKNIEIPDGVNSLYLTFSDTGLTDITLPHSVTGIGYGSFIDCKDLKTITIPSETTYIGENAFNGCNTLSDVYYRGTKEQWESIEIEEGNDPLLDASIHYSFNPTPTPTPIPTVTPTPSPTPTPASDWTGNEQITDLKAKSTPDGSDLTWSKIPEADGYLIGAIQNGKPYRQIDFIVGGNTTEYLDINASLTDYSYYWVFPYKKVNGKVIRGAASSIYVYGIKQLLAPKNLKATGKTGGVDLIWDSVSDADGFIIKRRTGTSGSAVVIADVTGTSYTDTTASTTDNSFYWVYAYKKSGNTKRPGAISSYAYAKAK